MLGKLLSEFSSHNFQKYTFYQNVNRKNDLKFENLKFHKYLNIGQNILKILSCLENDIKSKINFAHRYIGMLKF